MNILKELIMAKIKSVKEKKRLNIFLFFSYNPCNTLPAIAHTSPQTKQVRGIMNTLSHLSWFDISKGRIYSEMAVTQSIITLTFIICINMPSINVPVFSFTLPDFFSIFIPR